MLRLIQKHTIDIYNLKDKPFQIKTIPARDLLSEHRFDLYAKLYYIKYYQTNLDKAIRVYANHIKAFNPDWKEPGREDKQNLDDFLLTFNYLIDYFKNNEFDSSKSLIPINQDNIILDGAHRIAALAYWNRNVVVAQFNNIMPKCTFDYSYFINRGLPLDIANTIAHEMISWKPNLKIVLLVTPFLAFLKKKKDINTIKEIISPTYQKLYFSTSNSIRKLFQQIGKDINSLDDSSLYNLNSILFSVSYSLHEEQIQEMNEKLSIIPFKLYFIKDIEIIQKTSFLFLKEEGLMQWLYLNKITRIPFYAIERIYYLLFYFYHITLPQIKTFIYQIIFLKKR